MADETEKLLTRTPLPTTARLSSQKFGLVAFTAFGLLLIYLFITLHANKRVAEAPKPPPKPGEYEVTGPPTPDVALRLQNSYAGWNREPPPPAKPPASASAPDPTPMFAPTHTHPLPTTPPFQAQAVLSTTLPTEPPREQPHTTAETTKTTKQTTARKSWMKGELHLAKPPFEIKEKPTTQTPEDKKTNSVLQQAHWIIPEDPSHVLYRSQTIHGQLLHAVNSDIPGQIKVLVIRPVEDRFGQGVTLIPQYTVMIGEQQGKPVYGTHRLDVSIVELDYPDGTIVGLGKSKLTDKSGAVGGAGTVNNHYGKLGVAAVLSAVLNVGARSVAGNQTGYAPTIEQQTAGEIGSSVNRSGQSIVQRELQISPMITLKAGEEVAVHLQENLSFAQPPTPVK
jgi:type IV secretory pathway VirB10-like protein